MFCKSGPRVLALFTPNARIFKFSVYGAVVVTQYHCPLSYNKAVVDRILRPRCCQFATLSARPFRPLRPSRPRLRRQKKGPTFVGLQLALLRIVCSPAQGCAWASCASATATSSSLGSCANMTSSIKPEVFVTYHYAARGGPSHGHR